MSCLAFLVARVKVMWGVALIVKTQSSDDNQTVLYRRRHPDLVCANRLRCPNSPYKVDGAESSLTEILQVPTQSADLERRALGCRRAEGFHSVSRFAIRIEGVRSISTKPNLA